MVSEHIDQTADTSNLKEWKYIWSIIWKYLLARYWPNKIVNKYHSSGKDSEEFSKHINEGGGGNKNYKQRQGGNSQFGADKKR